MASSTPLPTHMRTGQKGERIAFEYLRTQGMKVHGHNLHIGRDEIDILAFDPSDHVLVFAEVKTRSRTDPYFTPALDLTPSKKRKLKRSARSWVDVFGYQGGYRIDVLYVVGDHVVDHIKELQW